MISDKLKVDAPLTLAADKDEGKLIKQTFSGLMGQLEEKDAKQLKEQMKSRRHVHIQSFAPATQLNKHNPAEEDYQRVEECFLRGVQAGARALIEAFQDEKLLNDIEGFEKAHKSKKGKPRLRTKAILERLELLSEGFQKAGWDIVEKDYEKAF